VTSDPKPASPPYAFATLDDVTVKLSPTDEFDLWDVQFDPWDVLLATVPTLTGPHRGEGEEERAAPPTPSAKCAGPNPARLGGPVSRPAQERPASDCCRCR
jgi:hypothetical protein